MNRIEASHQLMARVAWFALAVLLLTTVHHVYGAYVYDTPWRLHVGFVSGFAAAAILGALSVARRRRNDAFSDIAFWVFVVVTLVIPVLLIGLFEGGYNHVLKVALYFAGAPSPVMNRLFPPPTYERPDNLFFEITGVMQLVPGGFTGWFLYRLLRVRLTPSSSHCPHASGAEFLSA
jgi:hypothetical protein